MNTVSQRSAAAYARRASWLTVGDLLRAQATRSPNAPAVTEGDRTLSFQAFNTRINRLAHTLHALGVAHGACVAILSENRTEFVEFEFACAKIGAIACPLN